MGFTAEDSFHAADPVGHLGVSPEDDLVHLGKPYPAHTFGNRTPNAIPERVVGDLPHSTPVAEETGEIPEFSPPGLSASPTFPPIDLSRFFFAAQGTDAEHELGEVQPSIIATPVAEDPGGTPEFSPTAPTFLPDHFEEGKPATRPVQHLISSTESTRPPEPDGNQITPMSQPYVSKRRVLRGELQMGQGYNARRSGWRILQSPNESQTRELDGARWPGRRIVANEPTVLPFGDIKTVEGRGVVEREVRKVTEEEIKAVLAQLIEKEEIKAVLAQRIEKDVSKLNEASAQLIEEDVSKLNEALAQLKKEDISKLDKVQEIWDKIADSNTQEVASYGMEKLAVTLENRFPRISDPMIKLTQLWILKHVVTLGFDILNISDGGGIKLLMDVIDLVSDIYAIFNPVWATMKFFIALGKILRHISPTRNEIEFSIQRIQSSNELQTSQEARRSGQRILRSPNESQMGMYRFLRRPPEGGRVDQRGELQTGQGYNARRSGQRIHSPNLLFPSVLLPDSAMIRDRQRIRPSKELQTFKQYVAKKNVDIDQLSLVIGEFTEGKASVGVRVGNSKKVNFFAELEAEKAVKLVADITQLVAGIKQGIIDPEILSKQEGREGEGVSARVFNYAVELTKGTANSLIFGMLGGALVPVFGLGPAIGIALGMAAIQENSAPDILSGALLYSFGSGPAIGISLGAVAAAKLLQDKTSRE